MVQFKHLSFLQWCQPDQHPMFYLLRQADWILVLLPVVKINSSRVAKGKKALTHLSKPLSIKQHRSSESTNCVTLNTTEQCKGLIFHPGNCTPSSEQNHHLAKLVPLNSRETKFLRETWFGSPCLFICWSGIFTSLSTQCVLRYTGERPEKHQWEL